MATYSYPLSLPSSPSFTQSRWFLSRKTAINESPFTGQQQAFEYDYALWGAELTLPPMRRSEARNWVAFLMKLHGRVGTFLLPDPDGKTATGAISGSVTLNADIAVNDSTITLNTSQNSITNIFRSGDYIQIGSSATAKLYMIVDDTSSNSSGVVSVNIEPKIKTAGSAGASVVHASASGVFRMDAEELGWNADHISNYGITFSCTEAF